MTTRCRLTGEPHAVLLTHSRPRLIGANGITRHTIHAGLRIKLTRQREIHTNVGFDIVGNQVDDLLRISRIPDINVYQPKGML